MSFVHGDRPVQARLLLVGELLDTAAHDEPDPEQRIAFASAVAEGVLLDAATDFIDRVTAEFDDMKGVQNSDGVFELIVNGVLVAAERIQGCDGDVVPEHGVAGLEPVGVGGAGAAGHQVEQPGPGGLFISP